MTRSVHHGVTLVEVMVALAVMAINLVAWAAAVRLIVLLLQRTAELVSVLDGPADLAALCSLAVLVPVSMGTRGPRGALSSRVSPDSLMHMRRSGFTLVEVLVALALSAMVFGLVATGFVSAARFSRVSLASGDALTVRSALPTMLRQTIEVTGRGVSEGCALSIDASGRHVSVTFATPGDIAVVDEVFAALDGGGRPALYLRRAPHVRQPWIEGVTSFRVLDVEVGDDHRATAILAAIEHRALHQPLTVRVALPHRPCLEALP